jgi:hypothetical protein
MRVLEFFASPSGFHKAVASVLAAYVVPIQVVGALRRPPQQIVIGGTVVGNIQMADARIGGYLP